MHAKDCLWSKALMKNEENTVLHTNEKICVKAVEHNSNELKWKKN